MPKKPLLPIAKTLKNPDQIVDEFFNYLEKEQMIEHLISYQKLGDEGHWNTYRKRIPQELLVKWLKIMKKCQSNGFIAPRVWEEKIHWKQVMTRDRSNCDQCTMCPASFVAGECKGKMKHKPNGERNWTPCWKDGFDRPVQPIEPLPF